MSARVISKSDTKFVMKPWGWENWLTHDKCPYVLKEIFIRAPHKSSLQVHLEKYESAWIVEGAGYLHLCSSDIDVERYSSGGYTNDEVNHILDEYSYRRYIREGDLFHLPPGTIHRVEAITDIRLIESSTTQLDDVIRLRDDDNRPDGRIDSEHTRG